MDSDDEIEESSKWEGSPGTIILINALEDSSTLKIAHEATCLLMRQYLRTSSSHNVGVSIYGAEGTKTDFNTNNVIDILPMDVPTLQRYKKLRSSDIESFGKAKEFIFSEVLWHCSKIFKNCKKTLSSQTVIILTKLLNPPVETDQIRTLDRVGHLTRSQIKISIINISLNSYEINRFYGKFLTHANKSKEYTVPEPVWDSTIIQNMMYQQSHRHLAVAKLCFEIGVGFSIGVGVYSLLYKSSHSFHKTSKINSETDKIVTSVTMKTKQTITNENGSNAGSTDDTNKTVLEVPLLDSELLFCQEYGGERIEFTKKEKEAIDNPFESHTMKLLGFKPANKMCKEKWFLKTGYFLFPSESIIQGSTIAFKALHRACVEMESIALCMLCTRANSKPTIVALAPCTKPLDLPIEIGFDVIHVPFVENVRDIPLFDDDNETPINKTEMDKEMKKIVKTLLFDYKADMFENPKLQYLYRAIETKALNEDIPEPIDTTMRDPEIFKTIESDVFEEVFGSFGMLSLKRTGGQKNTESVSITKKVKTEDIDEISLQEMINNKTIKNLTVSQLKNILKNKNISFTNNLRKNDLIELVYKQYGTSS
ncbi:X-ray repair cross-complementing protein 5 [Battus philenor]|uniref:X-ray repair cross-complementing protein 5 n=1 Tax=Battus philenor TaxID=42288 RepID=UPI0035D0DB81